MKKGKASKSVKGKKLFVKQVEDNEVSDLIEVTDSIEELSQVEVGSRIEFEVADTEQKPPLRAALQGSSTTKDSWQQASADDNTILIKRTIRSGQSIQFDGNVVVMGDVNPGSEIIASGNIIVMGALRGVVHAGATGDEAATVSAFKLQPTQLRIANHITRAPDGDYPVPERPETARIKDGVVVIEIYQLGQDRQSKIC